MVYQLSPLAVDGYSGDLKIVFGQGVFFDRDYSPEPAFEPAVIYGEDFEVDGFPQQPRAGEALKTAINITITSSYTQMMKALGLSVSASLRYGSKVSGQFNMDAAFNMRETTHMTGRRISVVVSATQDLGVKRLIKEAEDRLTDTARRKAEDIWKENDPKKRETKIKQFKNRYGNEIPNRGYLRSALNWVLSFETKDESLYRQYRTSVNMSGSMGATSGSGSADLNREFSQAVREGRVNYTLLTAGGFSAADFMQSLDLKGMVGSDKKLEDILSVVMTGLIKTIGPEAPKKPEDVYVDPSLSLASATLTEKQLLANGRRRFPLARMVAVETIPMDDALSLGDPSPGNNFKISVSDKLVNDSIELYNDLDAAKTAIRAAGPEYDEARELVTAYQQELIPLIWEFAGVREDLNQNGEKEPAKRKTRSTADQIGAFDEVRHNFEGGRGLTFDPYYGFVPSINYHGPAMPVKAQLGFVSVDILDTSRSGQNTRNHTSAYEPENGTWSDIKLSDKVVLKMKMPEVKSFSGKALSLELGTQVRYTSFAPTTSRGTGFPVYVAQWAANFEQLAHADIKFSAKYDTMDVPVELNNGRLDLDLRRIPDDVRGAEKNLELVLDATKAPRAAFMDKTIIVLNGKYRPR